MAAVGLAGDVITIEFSSWEKFLTGRTRYTVPLTAIRQATVTDQPLRVPRGARRGLTISGRRKIGVWGLFSGRRQLVSVDRRLPGLHLLLDRRGLEDSFDEVIVSVPDAHHLAGAIKAVCA